ncbi:mRNA 3'-end-processing protein rna14 [Clarireedia jacksonii]
MAEEDAEIALLHQLQAGQEATAWGVGEDGQTEGEVPSNTEDNNEHVKKDSVTDDPSLRALSHSDAAGVSDNGVYAPVPVASVPAVTIIAEQDQSRSSSQTSMRKPKTVGGFLADDSDEENDDSTLTAAATGSLQPPASDNPKPSISPAPLQSSVTQQDLSLMTENQADLKANAPASTTVSVNASNVGTPIEQASVQVPASTTATQNMSGPKARLPHDKTGILEDRIKEDPRGDMEAWLSLISEHRKRNKLDDARAVYERFLKVFPHAAEIWVAYTEMELEFENFTAAEQIFGKSLLTVPNIQLWSVYLNYIRRMNDLTSDTTGNARATVSQAYDFVLANIGIDRDSGRIWQEYIQFIRSAPGQIGGSSWQDQQKMDQLRKAYQRAICVPMSSVNNLWKEYDQFELSLNKITGRKFIQEHSPSYMTARSANTALENTIRGLQRTTLPRLPPALGFEGDQEYLQQVELWKKWISWEQEDPLVLKTDELDAYKQRVLYVYKQAVMALRFWPEIWVDAAEWCFNNNLEKDGDTFLNDGIIANPESCLLAFKKADRLESTLPTEEAGKSDVEKGAIVRAPYNKLLDSLYELMKELKVRETREQARLEENSAIDASISAIVRNADEDDEDNDTDKEARDNAKALQLKALKQGYEMQRKLLQRTISFAWIALMRAMRRIQGNGAKSEGGGSRQIFADARARGMLTSEVYVASALIEHHVYKDKSGTKIFERGAKLFPNDELFILEYLKHLISISDITNARVAFETAVSRLTQVPENAHKAKPLYVYFHKYESQYGTLDQIKKLETRMSELFPEDPKLLRFSARYSGEGFDPTAVRPIVSPATQMKPKIVIQSIEQPPSVPDSPRPQYMQEQSPRPTQPPQYVQNTNSPKRPFPIEDFENELNRPRKLARGESPLKGAAGRRLDQQKRLQQNQGAPAWQSNAAPFVIPRDITFLLSIIPRADLYGLDPQLRNLKFNANALVHLLARTEVPDFNSWKAARDQPRYDGYSYHR